MAALLPLAGFPADAAAAAAPGGVEARARWVDIQRGERVERERERGKEKNKESEERRERKKEGGKAHTLSLLCQKQIKNPGAAVAYLLALVWLLCQTAEGARGALALLHPELGKPLPERSYEGDCGLLRRKAPAAAASGDGSSLSPPFSLFSSHELNLAALKSTLLDEFVVAHALGWWAKAILLRDRRLLWPLSVGFELAEAALAHALPNFRECWWDRWVLDVAVCNLVGMELGMATAALLRSRERGRGARERRSGGLLDAWGGVSTRRGALAKAGRVAAQFSPRSWEERDWDPRGSPRRAGWALFLVGAFLLFDVRGVFFFKVSRVFLFFLFLLSRLFSPVVSKTIHPREKK